MKRFRAVVKTEYFEAEYFEAEAGEVGGRTNQAGLDTSGAGELAAEGAGV